jgi:PAS domain S-box-containing protein
MLALGDALVDAQQYTNPTDDLAAMASARAATVAALAQFRIADDQRAQQQDAWEQTRGLLQGWLAQTEPRQIAVRLELLHGSPPAMFQMVRGNLASVSQLTQALAQLIALNERAIHAHQVSATAALQAAIATLISAIVLAVLITALLSTLVGGREHQFQALMEHATGLVAVLDAQQVCRYASPSFARLLGYAPRDLMGRVPTGLVHPDDLQALRVSMALDRTRAGDAREAECRVRHANGTYRWLRMVATNQLQDPIIQGIILTAYDVTDRRAAEEALRQSEQDYRHIFEHATDAIFMFTPEDGTILDVNGQACALYRLSREEFIGSTLWARSIDPAVTRMHVQAVLASRAQMHFETTHYRGDGTTVQVEVTTSLIKFGGREVMLSINRDVTERAQALQAAEDLARMRADFLSSISHELRTPLTAALGFAELLQERWDTLGDAVRRDKVDRIVMATRRQHHLVDQLLEVVRLDNDTIRNDTIRVRHDDLEIGRLIEEAAEEVRVTYGGAAVLLDGSQTLGVCGDAGRIVQIMSNLVDNALKYSPEDSRVEVQWEASGDMVLVRVRNFGQGIPEEGRSMLFTRFGRVPGSAIRAGRVGTGLGLFIGRRLARAMGGDLDLESTGTEGTTFLLTLPRIAGSPLLGQGTAPVTAAVLASAVSPRLAARR